MIRRIVVLLALLVVGLCGPIASADSNRGLFMTPVREYLTVEAGKSVGGSFTLANITDRRAEITLSVEQFTVENYTYDYRFVPSKRNWIKLPATELELLPGKSKEVSYTISTPDNAAPGGYYFTIFATEKLDTERKVRVGEALYVTVAGELKLTGHIQKASLPSIVLTGEIPYSFDIKSTGNTHYFAYVSGSLKGFLTDQAGAEATHIILPGTLRTVKGAIPPPPLPGIYQVVYGYRVDDGQTITNTHYVAYVPLWFLAVLAGALLIGVALIRRHRRRKITDS